MPILYQARHVVRHYFLHILCGTLVLMSGVLLLWSGIEASSPILFLDTFTYPDGIVTNEYAHWNAGNSSSRTNPNWDLTSGSLFAQGSAGWGGTPDDATPDATSSTGTNSAVFRLNTKRFDFGDTKTSFKLKINSLISTTTTPAVAWDGVHIFLRYQSEYNLYYASVNRRDASVVIKKKCAGGNSNGGTYYELGPGEVSGHPIPLGTWQNVAASVQNDPSGSVTIRLYRDGAQVAAATDFGVGCAPIRAPGATGIRGDNADFLFDDFTVETLAAATSSPSPVPSYSGTPAPSNHSTSPRPTATPDPTPRAAKTGPIAQPAPSITPASPGTGKPGPLNTSVLVLAAHTQPAFWYGGLALLLALILLSLLIRDHLRARSR